MSQGLQGKGAAPELNKVLWVFMPLSWQAGVLRSWDAATGSLNFCSIYSCFSNGHYSTRTNMCVKPMVLHGIYNIGICADEAAFFVYMHCKHHFPFLKRWVNQ